MIIVAKPLSALIEKFFTVSCFFFMGAALGGFNTVYNKTKRYKFNFMSVIYIILGFVLGSIMQVFPGLPKSAVEWILCPLLFVSAYLLIRLLQRFDPDMINKK